MVVCDSLSDPELDRLFRALADSTRRDIVARVLGGEDASVSTLASRYDMSFAAVQKHVTVLEDAGLVTKERRGRERIVRGNPEQVARARALLVRLERLWRERFQQLDDLLADTVPGEAGLAMPAPIPAPRLTPRPRSTCAPADPDAPEPNPEE
jgi:DNA-binding transcriptional ArsR family regulator